jgi:lysophospholipase L1-like esterase
MRPVRALAAALAGSAVLVACTAVDPPAGTRSRSPAPAPAAPAAGPATYLALGDSVTAGVGAPDPGTGGYAPVLAELLSARLGCDADQRAPGCPLRLRNLGEGGATTATLQRTQLPVALGLLRGPAQVRLVTVTVGGNDVFAPVLRACAAAARSRTCSDTVAAAVRRADAGLDEVLGELTAAAGPGTTLAVMAYYDPLPACRLAVLQPLAEQVLEGGEHGPGLNEVLRARAAQHGARVVETREQLSTPGDFVGGDDCLHPSGQGHARIAEAFRDVVGEAVAGEPG